MIFQSSLGKVVPNRYRGERQVDRYQLYALSIPELEYAVSEVKRVWPQKASWKPQTDGERAESSKLYPAHLVAPKKDPNKVDPIHFQLSWPMPNTLDYRTRSVPRILVDPDYVADLDNLPFEVPVIDHHYCVVASQMAKLTYFTSRWHLEGVLKQEVDAETKRLKQEHEIAFQAYLKNRANSTEPPPPKLPDPYPRADSLQTITDYYESRIRHHLVILLKNNRWVDSPRVDPTLTPRQARTYARLNEVFSRVDLKRQSGMCFAQDPGPLVSYQRK